MMSKAVVVAGLAGGSGKSVAAVGLVAAFAARNKTVVPFKKGPDYIDAGWLQLAAGRKCYNLDPYLVAQQQLRQTFLSRSYGSDIVILEGNRGLYDGVNVDGGYSTAELSVILGLPVILVVNCTKTTRTVAAQVLGCIHFDKRVNIAGVILNQIATERQRKLITEAVEKYTGVPVLGTIPRMTRDVFPMRHLGMIPHQEYDDSRGALSLLKETVANNVDLERVMELMTPIEPIERQEDARAVADGDQVKIGVIQDEAFQFYYSENLEALEKQGAELVMVNALSDSQLPDIDGLYIGGGFPETSVKELSANQSFRNSLKSAADDGLPIYAECGGLIYLGESLEIDGVAYPLANVFPARFGMSKKPQAHGYSVVKVIQQNPFYEVGTTIKGHEFRYSTVKNSEWNADEMALEIERGKGFLEKKDGLIYNNVFATYTHIHADGTPEWAPGLVSCCQKYRTGR